MTMPTRTTTSGVLSTGFVDQNFSYAWGTGNVLNSGRADDVLVHWYGCISTGSNASVQFRFDADDGTRLRLDGTQISTDSLDWIDKGGGGGTTASQSFTAVTHKLFDLYFYERGGGAKVTLEWNLGGSWVTVPASAFRCTYPVTFNANGGTGSMSNQNIFASQSTSLRANTFSRTGYTFAGWNTQANGFGTNYANGGAITITAPVTLFARWTAASQSITYNNNLGSGSISATVANTDASTTLSNGAGFSRSGYDLVSWNTQSDGLGTSYDLSDSLTMPAGGLSLFAIWQSNLAISTPVSGLNARVGEAFSLSINSTGGSGTNVFTASSLPTGLSIAPDTGVISGTPTLGGTTSFTVTVTDSSGMAKTTSSFTITVAAAALANAAAPTASAVSASTTSITVSWDAIANATNYTLQIYDSAENVIETISAISSTSQTVEDLAPSTTYKFSIQAIGDGISYSTSSESSLVSATTHAPVSVSINRSLTNPYSSRQISYTFTFSEAISGFTTSNITLSGTSTGWSKGTLSGSGTTYFMTITNSSPQDGDIDLDLSNTGIAAVSSAVVGPNATATYTLGRATQVTTWIKFLWGEDLVRF